MGTDLGGGNRPRGWGQGLKEWEQASREMPEIAVNDMTRRAESGHAIRILAIISTVCKWVTSIERLDAQRLMELERLVIMYT